MRTQNGPIVVLTTEPDGAHIRELCSRLKKDKLPFQVEKGFVLPKDRLGGKCFVVVDNRTRDVEFTSDEWSIEFLFVGYPRVLANPNFLYADLPSTVVDYFRIYANLEEPQEPPPTLAIPAPAPTPAHPKPNPSKANASKSQPPPAPAAPSPNVLHLPNC